MLVLSRTATAEERPRAIDVEPTSQSRIRRPPPINVDYLQFGVSFNGIFTLSSGAVCPTDALVPCILGSGGGLAARAGYRSRGPFYIGGAYEFQKLNTSSLMRLGVLQQLGGEARFFIPLGLRTEPFLLAGAGGVAFGNEWATDTFGIGTFVGAGFEVQITRTTIVGFAPRYRPILLFGWTDRAGQERETGIAHYVGFDVMLEAREPLQTH